jgi:hypothetical protein
MALFTVVITAMPMAAGTMAPVAIMGASVVTTADHGGFGGGHGAGGGHGGEGGHF